MTIEIRWVLVLIQLPSEPSRHRVAVWRELRKVGAVPVSPGTWALPAGATFQSALDRAGELTRNGGGVFAVIDASPRDEASTNLIRDAFAAARVDEWTEFIADCGKFDAEIAREIAEAKFTFGELEEEEQSLDRLRRWFRDLKKRDVLVLPEADAAEDRLRECESLLDGYAERVYQVMHGSTPAIDTPPEPHESQSQASQGRVR
ncbi:MAG TPA: Chromate resistance protein ChrB [Microbacteriaceae bacterium]